MRRSVVIIFLISLFAGCKHKVKQPNVLESFKREIPDTLSRLYKQQQYIYKVIGLPNLSKSIDSFHFRFSTECQVVDIWQDKDRTYQGTLTNFTTKLNAKRYKNGFPVESAFKSSMRDIDKAKAREIYNAIKDLQILDIPSDSKIKGWSNGCDGYYYIIECSNYSNYSFKYYWTPRAFKNKVSEAAKIDSLSKVLNLQLGLDRALNQFVDNLIPGCYSMGFMNVRCNKSTNTHKGHKQ